MTPTRWLGQVEYLPTFEAMQAFTASRDAGTAVALAIVRLLALACFAFAALGASRFGLPRLWEGAEWPRWMLAGAGLLAWSLLESRAVREIADLHATLAGRIRVQAVTQLEIASSDLRAIITSGRDPRFLVPDAVCEIIRRTQCYARSQQRHPT